MNATRIINALAPLRVCDNGGWTDTWFAEHGEIFNIAVHPCVEVQIEVRPRGSGDEHIVVFAENYNERFAVEPGAGWHHHPLIEASIERMGVPDDLSIAITIFSQVPAGASTGTSAAVSVALLGALSELTGAGLSARQIAYEAHAVETDMLRRQSGIQDQLCAALGGINVIRMDRYPHATVESLSLPDATWWELNRRLVLIFLGRTHDSSAIHRMVIRDLENAGPDDTRIEALRVTAARSSDAVMRGDYAALGRAMSDNTEAQAGLHRELVSDEARRVIDLARRHGALGWKVNGAGGSGGSITLLCGDGSREQRAMIRAIEGDSGLFRHIPTRISRAGLRVWQTRC